LPAEIRLCILELRKLERTLELDAPSFFAFKKKWILIIPNESISYKMLMLYFIVLFLFFFLAKKNFINFSYIYMLFIYMILYHVKIDQFL